MPHAVAGRAAVGALLERKETRRRKDLTPAHDHRAVVKRRPGHEDRRQELGGELAVHRDAGLAVILQPGGPLENDERAVLGLADEERGPHQLVDDPLELLLATRRQKAVQRSSWPSCPSARRSSG